MGVEVGFLRCNFDLRLVVVLLSRVGGRVVGWSGGRVGGRKIGG